MWTLPAVVMVGQTDGLPGDISHAGQGEPEPDERCMVAVEAENASNYVEKTPSMDAWSVWNYREGESIRVVCYTNAVKAKLR
ncbi:hypothetical protein SDC9_210672 [bioreactor metagenome]|uniref:Uncharacterized protein n=1 Tax=bioreactor metagenome TaxID=1076179 RepID=A0A645JJN0_9ZZZZ